MQTTRTPTTPRRPDRSTVRFTMTSRGTPRIIEHRNRRHYRELLRETPQWNADLQVEQDDDGDWVIVALLPSRWTHGQHGLEKNVLGSGHCWDTEDEAQQHLDEHEDELRLELVEDLFTMALCTRCDAVVPVFGDYVPFAPAGMLVCGPCLSGNENDPDPPGPAILHP